MKQRRLWMGIFSFILIVFLTISFPGTSFSQAKPAKLKFDHNYTFKEVVTYLQEVVEAYPSITRLHNIGKSYLGKDLLVLEITNQSQDGLKKPGYWIDGNLHSSEVMGADVCLKTIETLVTQYGRDPFITNLLDTRTIYILPKFNPDGSELYLTTPLRNRSSVRPYDQDGDGLKDEDPPEDLNGDGYITLMRVRDEMGEWKTSPDDPRLMVRRQEDEKGEWRVYTEGIDNDGDDKFNEDSPGGLDLNRNWPAVWQQAHIQSGSGEFPLSEPENRAVADFLLSHRNIMGIVNHHMAGNFMYRPPCNLNFDPITGEETQLLEKDEANYQVFGKKYSEIINDQPVRTVKGRAGPPRYGAIWGVFIDWAYWHYGVFGWVPEMGSLVPYCDYDEDGTVTELERLRWNDEEMDGKIFVDWEPYDHPQLGKVEIGGFVDKIYNPAYGSYTHLFCTPGSIYDDFLEKHTKWNLYMVSMSPLVRITDVKVIPEGSGFFKITASIQNQGFLPTNLTQQAIRNQTAKTVKAEISLSNATLVMGEEQIDLGHLPGNTPRSTSPVKKVEWLVKTDSETPTAEIRVFSEKGGTDIKVIE